MRFVSKEKVSLATEQLKADCLENSQSEHVCNAIKTYQLLDKALKFAQGALGSRRYWVGFANWK